MFTCGDCLRNGDVTGEIPVLCGRKKSAVKLQCCHALQGEVCRRSATCTPPSCKLETCGPPVCYPACPSSKTCCTDRHADAICVDTSSDIENCGVCGVVCPSPQVCSHGSCQSPCGPGQTLCMGIGGIDCCDPGGVCCSDGSCHNAGTVCCSIPGSAFDYFCGAPTPTCCGTSYTNDQGQNVFQPNCCP